MIGDVRPSRAAGPRTATPLDRAGHGNNHQLERIQHEVGRRGASRRRVCRSAAVRGRMSAAERTTGAAPSTAVTVAIRRRPPVPDPPAGRRAAGDRPAPGLRPQCGGPPAARPGSCSRRWRRRRAPATRRRRHAARRHPAGPRRTRGCRRRHARRSPSAAGCRSSAWWRAARPERPAAATRTLPRAQRRAATAGNTAEWEEPARRPRRAGCPPSPPARYWRSGRSRRGPPWRPAAAHARVRHACAPHRPRCHLPAALLRRGAGIQLILHDLPQLKAFWSGMSAS